MTNDYHEQASNASGFKTGDLVVKSKYDRGPLEVVAIQGDQLILGKYSRVAVSKKSVRHADHPVQDHEMIELSGNAGGLEKLCVECGSSDLYIGSEIKDPKMCFSCFAAMTGFTSVGEVVIESDDLIPSNSTELETAEMIHYSTACEVIDK